MLSLLDKIQNLQKRAAGKVHFDVGILNDSGAIFGGFVREPEVSINVRTVGLFNDSSYIESWDFYQFYPMSKNEEMWRDLKDKTEQHIREFDTEWKRIEKHWCNQ